MQYTHCSDMGFYKLYKDHGDGTADFIKIDMMGKINRIRVENRTVTYTWNEMKIA